MLFFYGTLYYNICKVRSRVNDSYDVHMFIKTKICISIVALRRLWNTSSGFIPPHPTQWFSTDEALPPHLRRANLTDESSVFHNSITIIIVCIIIKKINCVLFITVLSLFTVVTFPNGGCAGASGDNGTCMTARECSARGGSANGYCANGFGLCCICECFIILNVFTRQVWSLFKWRLLCFLKKGISNDFCPLLVELVKLKLWATCLWTTSFLIYFTFV